MRLVKAKHTIYSPVRANLLGGWTDQLLWDKAAAVVNFAFGWHDDKCYQGAYPLMLDKLGRFYSTIHGRGTGLGISSIRAAMFYMQAFPDKPKGYVRFVLEYEKAILGTEGGWQDQIGGMEPGFKLITSPEDATSRHNVFDIAQRDDHPILERMVVFDTGIRRESGAIGNRVRFLMSRDEPFRAHLQEIAKMAKECFYGSADEMISACLHSWAIFTRFVPEMSAGVAIPKTELIIGHILLGAGGGGYGLAFTESKADRQEIVQLFNDKGLWATIPVLLPGVSLVSTED